MLVLKEIKDFSMDKQKFMTSLQVTSCNKNINRVYIFLLCNIFPVFFCDNVPFFRIFQLLFEFVFAEEDQNT